jgi:hypothetical protein
MIGIVGVGLMLYVTFARMQWANDETQQHDRITTILLQQAERSDDCCMCPNFLPSWETADVNTTKRNYQRPGTKPLYMLDPNPVCAGSCEVNAVTPEGTQLAQELEEATSTNRTKRKIILGLHHKTGTALMDGVFKSIANLTGKQYL